MQIAEEHETAGNVQFVRIHQVSEFLVGEGRGIEVIVKASCSYTESIFPFALLPD